MSSNQRKRVSSVRMIRQMDEENQVNHQQQVRMDARRYTAASADDLGSPWSITIVQEAFRFNLKS